GGLGIAKQKATARYLSVAERDREFCRRGTKRIPSSTSVSSLAGELLGIDLDSLRRGLVEQDEDEGFAGLGHDITALARDLSVDAARILGNHFAEAVALDGHLMSGLDPVVELHDVLEPPHHRG